MEFASLASLVTSLRVIGAARGELCAQRTCNCSVASLWAPDRQLLAECPLRQTRALQTHHPTSRVASYSLLVMGCSASARIGQEVLPASTGVQTVAPAGTLRKSLISLGETFSIEVGPSDVYSSGGEGAKAKGPKLLSLLAEASATGGRPLLRRGAPVHVNMVKPVMSHFHDVASATRALADAGFAAVPHLPASRFQTAADLHTTLDSLANAGARSLLVLGGNDLVEQTAGGACAFSGGARALLESEMDTIKARGFTRVELAGHPDGHPGLGWDKAATNGLLIDKVSTVFRSGLNVAIATQFCFDARKLVRWLAGMRQEIRRVLSQLEPELPESPDAASRRVVFHIGIPGPTSRKKLERIAKICEVPSLFISSAFDIIDLDRDGMISLEELQKGIDKLGLARQGSKLHSMYVKHAGADGLLSPDEFAQLLVEDAGASRNVSKHKAPDAQPQGTVALGPSASVTGGGGEGDGSRIVWPEELVLALAGYCDREQVPLGEVVLHVFPFGGLQLAFELTTKLSEGTWPPLTGEVVQSGLIR